MSAKPCECGKLIVFAKDPDGGWQVLDNVAPTWEQIGFKDGTARVIRSKAMVSHSAVCLKANKFSAGGREPRPERDFTQPEGAD